MFIFSLKFSFYKTIIFSQFNKLHILLAKQFGRASILCRRDIFTERILAHELVSSSQSVLCCKGTEVGVSCLFSSKSLLGRRSDIFCLFISDHTMSPFSLTILLLLSKKMLGTNRLQFTVIFTSFSENYII
jgi:hypothetical protein